MSDFQERYKRAIIILATLFIACFLIALLSVPRRNAEEEAKIETVNVLVTKVDTKRVDTGKNSATKQYYIEIVENGANRRLGPFPTASYQVGGTYEMYSYMDNVYTDRESAVSATRYNRSNVFFRVAVLGAFVSLIVLIGAIAGAVQAKKKQAKKQPIR